MKEIKGGVVAAQGFTASGVHCGIRKNRTKRDLALIYSEKRATTACVYTTNLVVGAPIEVTRAHIADGYAQAMICNSGNANTCNSDGIEIATQTCDLLSKELNIEASDIVIASTGVIGQHMSLEPFRAGIPFLVKELGAHSDHAAEGIMTTDITLKETAVEFTIGGKICHMGGIAKGSGMIHPNMATMLVFITSDVAIAPTLLQEALSGDIKDTFNMLSIDGDTSTNDMVMVMANGMSGNAMITDEGADFDTFKQALRAVNSYLCKRIAADGEGATKMIEVHVKGGYDTMAARKVAKSIVCSSLVKSAMFGADANWGRVLCAIGYAGAQVNVQGVRVDFASMSGRVNVCEKGAGVDFDEDLAHNILLDKEITIDVTLCDGDAVATAYGCDLTYEYVKINSAYRS